MDYISLTDIARVRNPDEPKDVVKNWLRNRSTIEYLGLWEKINNSDFKGVEFDTFKAQAGSNSFTMSPGKWIAATGAIGITARAWRDNNNNLEGNIRDYATVEQLVVLSNLESLNAVLIRQGVPQPERLAALNDVAITQLISLTQNYSLRRLK